MYDPCPYVLVIESDQCLLGFGPWGANPSKGYM